MSSETRPMRAPLGVRGPIARAEAPYVVAGVAVALAFAIRLAVALSPSTAVLDSDQAVTGIVAQRIGSGQDFPVFFPGQTYMGTLEQYLQAGVLLVAPDTKLALQIVGVVLATLTTGLVFLVGRRVCGSAWGGALAALIFAIGPWYLIDKGIKSHGAYAAGTLLALACLYLAYRLRPRTSAAPWVAAGIGLTAGLVFWELWLGFYVLIPALVWALASVRRDPLLLVFGGAGALVGAAPFLAQRLANGLDQPWGYDQNPPSTVASRASGLLDPVTGMFLGAAKIGDGAPVVSFVVPAFVTAIAIGLLGAAVWRRRRGLLALVTLREGERRPIDAVLLAFLISPILYVASDAAWFTGEPRYLFTLYPMLAIGLAAGAMAQGPRLRLPVALCALAFVGGLTFVSARDAFRGEGVTFTIVGGGTIVMDEIDEAAAEMERLGVDGVYADYWLAYPLGYASDGDLVVAPFTNSRFPDLDAEVAADETPAIAAPVGPAADQVRARLTETDTEFVEDQAGSVAVFHELSPRRTPAELGLLP